MKMKINFSMDAEIEVDPETFVEENRNPKDMIEFEFSRMSSILKIEDIKPKEIEV